MLCVCSGIADNTFVWNCRMLYCTEASARWKALNSSSAAAAVRLSPPLHRGDNVSGAGRGSLSDKPVWEHLPDRKLLACVCALFVSLWIPARQNTLRIRLMSPVFVGEAYHLGEKLAKKHPTTTTTTTTTPPKQPFTDVIHIQSCWQEPFLSLWSSICVTLTCMFLITGLAIITSQVRIH